MDLTVGASNSDSSEQDQVGEKSRMKFDLTIYL